MDDLNINLVNLDIIANIYTINFVYDVNRRLSNITRTTSLYLSTLVNNLFYKFKLTYVENVV